MASASQCQNLSLNSSGISLQLYVLSSECQNGSVMPAAWALLPDKKSATYKKVKVSFISVSCSMTVDFGLLSNLINSCGRW